MFHIICTLPNASHDINSIAFKDNDGEDGGVVTVSPVNVETAAFFTGINGYSIVDAVAEGAPAPKAAKKARAAAAAEPEPVVVADPEPEVVADPEPVMEDVVELAPEVVVEPAVEPVVEAEAQPAEGIF